MNRCGFIGLLLVVMSAGCAAAAEGPHRQDLAGTAVDPAELVDAAATNLRRSNRLIRNYTYQVVQETFVYDKHRNPVWHRVDKSDVTSAYHHLIERDGKPLLGPEAKEAEKEDIRYRQTRAQVNATIPA